MTELRLTDEQQRAVDRRDGSLLVSAGAGAGKTSVLAERFVRAVLDDGVPVDAILAITFTEKAAGELAHRVRRRFLDLGAVDEARAAENAWISTIHGFCSRVLRAHALAAGIDPEYAVLEEIDAERIALDAFDRALEELLAGDDESVRLAVVAAYTPDRLAEMVRTTHGRLRSRGQVRPALPDREPPRSSADPVALRSAAEAALAELAGAEGVTVERARAAIDRCLRLLDADGLAGADRKQLERLAAKPGNAKALQGPAYADYLALVGRLCAEAAAVHEYEMHLLLDQLLRSYSSHYERLKAERSALDFDDLELRTKALLEGDPAVRDEYAHRFRHVMVDEFQDTNPLQDEILGLIAGDNVFRVGDDRQSIYRFRHADVGLFRGYREQARTTGREEQITLNFRSRGEILDAVNHVFAELWGPEFEPLRERPGVRDEPPRVAPCVELLVADRDSHRAGRWKARAAVDGSGPDADAGDPAETLFGPTMRGVAAWRAAEARLLARRIDELAGEGKPFAYSDVVILLRATTSASIYERTLEERGVPTHVLGGRGYWSQQQVGDLRSYLAALANPNDELALYSALASPLAGVSLDGLVLVARYARRSGRGAWQALAGLADGDPVAAALAESLPAGDLAAIAAFARRLRDDRAVATRVSLETLIDRAVTLSGYDRAILALPAGDRRLANVRKLMRMAREFEAREGRDLRRFIDFVAERDLIQEREGQAPLEAERLNAVRIMTIHRAKGLEFPVVCVADLGKAGREDDAALRIGEAGEVGIRLASLDGGSFDGAEMERLRERDRVEAEAEERRIFYVALTRAQEHLVLSGATDLEQLPPAEDLSEPMRWLRAGLAPQLNDLGARGESVVDHDGRPLAVRCEVLSAATLDELLPPGQRDPASPEPEPAALDALDAPALSGVTVPRAQPVSRISYSQLQRYSACGYRFYLERVLQLPPVSDVITADVARAEEPALAPTVRGSVVHALLEELDFARPAAPDPARVAELIAAFGDEARQAEVAEIIDLVTRFTGSALCRRLGSAPSVRTELEFAFDLATGADRSVLVTGVVDVHATEEGRTLVVDYKTDRLGERAPAEAVEDSYSTQRTVYALAALRGGAETAEVVYAFLEQPDETVSAVYEAADISILEQRLRGLSTGIVEGRFVPSEQPWRGLCAGCPGRRSLCTWTSEETLAELPMAPVPS